eukprot:s954_g14.t1
MAVSTAASDTSAALECWHVSGVRFQTFQTVHLGEREHPWRTALRHCVLPPEHTWYIFVPILLLRASLTPFLKQNPPSLQRLTKEC